ncbi:MAG TPA: hypothetical protein VG223_02725 [Solirubrobacteraceae bacterium]|nr:hypothetical protein [Solirubrobacteraceae bacterium]
MNSPQTVSKLLLVADERGGAPAASAPLVRRYRLARLRLDGRSSAPGARFDHLKRVFD